MATKGLIQKMLNFLEDPKYPSVGPHLRFLGLTGLWHPTITPLSKFKLYVFYFTVAFFFSQYIKCLFSLDPNSFHLILQYAPFHIGIICKACLFQKDYNSWEKLIEYTSITENSQLASNDEVVKKIVKNYIQRNRQVSYFFWIFCFFANISIWLEPYQKNVFVENGTSVYLNIVDGYTPFSKEPPGYYASMFVQTVLGLIVSNYTVSWDAFVWSLMIMFAGQLVVVRHKCVHVTNDDNTHQNIAEIHRFYLTLVKFHKLFNSLISPTMFVYLIVSSVNLGIEVIQISKHKDDLATLVSSCVYVVACLIQLLIFYWHSNEVTVQSTLVSYGTFESDWVKLDPKLRKEIALLGIATGKRLVFKAGPCNEMTVSTFIAILRTSYRFFTLLNETK